ncbi:ECF RNA polymerase sigma factor SigK [Arthrobacter sp. MDB2-24]
MLTAPLPVLSPRSSPPDPSARAGGPVSVGPLLLRVADGDVAAFTTLYECTSRRVYGLVRRVLVDAEMSAETTQDVYLALWQGGAARFEPALGSGMSWILTLAHRRAVDRVRAEESSRARDLNWGIRNRDVDYDQVADAVVQRAETDAIRAGLRMLSAVQREAIDLAYYAGMTYTQVADHLGIPVPTAKTRIRDGIKRLSSCLQESA